LPEWIDLLNKFKDFIKIRKTRKNDRKTIFLRMRGYFEEN